jgi:hypothetical protein
MKNSFHSVRKEDNLWNYLTKNIIVKTLQN